VALNEVQTTNTIGLIVLVFGYGSASREAVDTFLTLEIQDECHKAKWYKTASTEASKFFKPEDHNKKY
jgi:hypothetical protein